MVSLLMTWIHQKIVIITITIITITITILNIITKRN